MIKRKFVMLILSAVMLILSASLITGCGSLRPGLVEYDLPDHTMQTGIQEKEEVQEESNEEVALSSDFMETYIDMDSFAEQKQRTLDGIRITNDLADMSEGEIQLWAQIIADADYNQYTTDDLERRKAELNAILDSLAASQHMTVEEFLANEDIGMDLPSAREFLDRQAEKFAQSYETYQQNAVLPEEAQDEPASNAEPNNKTQQNTAVQPKGIE